jgi:hypothetical protein
VAHAKPWYWYHPGPEVYTTFISSSLPFVLATALDALAEAFLQEKGAHSAGAELPEGPWEG